MTDRFVCKVRDVAGLHIALCVDIDIFCPVIHFHIARWLDNFVQGVAILFNFDSTHGKRNDQISLFNKGVVQITSIHSGVGGGGNRTGWRIQAVNFASHVVVCGRGKVDLISGFVL